MSHPDTKFPDLRSTWAFLSTNSRAETTQQSRRAAIHLYVYFCFRYSLLVKVNNPPFTHRLPPPDPGVLAYYLCYLYKNNYMLGTIKAYLSTVRTYYADQRLPDPYLDPTTGYSAIEPLTILRAIKRDLRGQGRQRFPVTRVMMQRTGLILRALPDVPTVKPDPLLSLNVRAAMSVAWFGLLRCSGFTMKSEIFRSNKHVPRNNVTFLPNKQNPAHTELVIPDSKVDPGPLVRQGFVLRLYKVDSDLCPVQALPGLFEHDPDDNLMRPLFDFRTQLERTRAPPRPTRYRFAMRVSTVLKAAGFDDTSDTGQRITTHSFRSGGAMALANAGVPTHVLQMAGCWRSNAFMFYVTQPVEELRLLTTRMVNAACHHDTAWGYRPPV